jgi:hypothetical protein
VFIKEKEKETIVHFTFSFMGMETLTPIGADTTPQAKLVLSVVFCVF